MDTIKAWSFSALSTYEECPFHSKLSKILKVPELPRPMPPNGKTEHANDRGSRVHDEAEYFVKGERDSLLKDLKTFEPEFLALRQWYEAGKVSLEHMWCFNRDWHPVKPDDFKNTWLRIKLDALVFLTDTTGLVIDYKTGKKWGNEIKHAQQGQLYQLGAFIKYPQLEYVTTEFWYLDQNEISSMNYRRDQGLRFYNKFNKRGLEMTTDTVFKPKPNGHSCKFCPYGPEEFSNKWVNKNGACPHGVA